MRQGSIVYRLYCLYIGKMLLPGLVDANLVQVQTMEDNWVLFGEDYTGTNH